MANTPSRLGTLLFGLIVAFAAGSACKTTESERADETTVADEAGGPVSVDRGPVAIAPLRRRNVARGGADRGGGPPKSSAQRVPQTDGLGGDAARPVRGDVGMMGERCLVVCSARNVGGQRWGNSG